MKRVDFDSTEKELQWYRDHVRMPSSIDSLYSLADWKSMSQFDGYVVDCSFDWHSI